MIRSSRAAVRRWAVIGGAGLAVTLSACGSTTAGVATPASTLSSTSSSTSSSSDGTSSDGTSSSDSSSASDTTSSETTSQDTTSSETTSSETTSQETTSSDSTSSEATSADSSPSSATTATPTSSATAVNGPVLPVSKPGTRVKIGKSVVVEFALGKKTSSYYQHGTMSVTVTKIVKQSPSIFDKLKNKKDFAGYTPYYIFADNKILTIESKTKSAPINPLLDGVLKDGREAGSVFGLGSLQGCEDVYFKDAQVGGTSTSCTIALAKTTGAQVVGVAFQGSGDLYTDRSKNPYLDKPILWLP